MCVCVCVYVSVWRSRKVRQREGEREGGRNRQTKQDMDDIKHDEGLCPFRKGPDRRVNCVEAARGGGRGGGGGGGGGERGSCVVEDGRPQEGVKRIVCG